MSHSTGLILRLGFYLLVAGFAYFYLHEPPPRETISLTMDQTGKLTSHGKVVSFKDLAIRVWEIENSGQEAEIAISTTGMVSAEAERVVANLKSHPGLEEVMIIRVYHSP